MRERTHPTGGTPPRTLSTERLLSTVAGAVVLVVMATGVAITWWTLTEASLHNAQDRLQRGVRQLAAVSATSIRQSQPRFAAVARNAGVHVALRFPQRGESVADTAVIAALQTLRSPTDSGLPIELWRAADGKRIAVLGTDVPSEVRLGFPGETAPPNRPLRQGLDSLALRDSLQVGQLYLQGDRTYLWAALPVVDSGRVIGYVLKQSCIAARATESDHSQAERDRSRDTSKR